MAPDVGFEPTTKRLPAASSTAELIRIKSQNYILNLSKSQGKSETQDLFSCQDKLEKNCIYFLWI